MRIIVIILYATCLVGCYEEEFLNSPEINLSFSTDTVFFDTVFTTVGTSTFSIKIYNEESEAVLIDRIYLDEKHDQFRMNVDGIPGPSITDVEIEANDSIYVFLEATIDPDQNISVSPFVLESTLHIEANETHYSVPIIAFGQNANYIPSNRNSGGFALLNCSGSEVIWDDPRPYVIYGVLVIDSCTLHIPAGKKIYIHGGLVSDEQIFYNDGLIIIGPTGKINVEGNAGERVIFQGDRLEEVFSEVPGQWAGIRILSGSKGNLFNYATIKNSVVGIQLDSASECQISNAIFKNQSAVAINALHATASVENTLVYNSGSYGVRFGYGGNYYMNHCTIHTSGSNIESIRLDNYLCLDQFCNQYRESDLFAEILNSSFTGSSSNEVFVSDVDPGDGQQDLTIIMENCLYQSENDTLLIPCNDCIKYNRFDPLYVDPSAGNFHVDTMSVLIDEGKVSEIDVDLEGRPRDAQPDIGAYEFIK